MENYGKLIEYLNHDSVVSLESVDTVNVASLYKENKFYQILSMMSVGESNSSVRLVFALTLFQLGRFKAALRELAVAMELEVDPGERQRFIMYEIKLFAILKLDRSQPCLQELGEKAVGSSILSLDVNVPDEEGMPLHCQAVEYEKWGKLNEFSIGKISISVHHLVQESLDSFDSKTKDPLVPLIKAINLHGPSYLYAPVAENASQYVGYVTALANKYPEVDLEMDIKPLTKMLVRARFNPNNFLTDVIIKIQYVKGFLQLVKGNHYEASYHYLWLMNFIEISKNKSPRFFNKTEMFNQSMQRNCMILLCNCMDFGKLDYSEFTLENVMLKTCDPIPNLPAEFFSNRLWKYFFSHGLIYEMLSIKRAKSYQINNGMFERFDSSYIEDMVKKYIFAVCFKPQDDPTILQIVDRIIWGLLVYGGIHLETVWFFSRLKNYYQVSFDLGPFQTSEKIFGNYHTYSNLGERLCRLNDLPGQLSEEDTWDISNGEVFLLPIAYKHGDRLEFMDKFYDETSLYYDPKNFIVDENGLSTKLKSHCKTSHKLLRQKYDISRELIVLFADTYSQYHGQCPVSTKEMP